MYGDDQDIELRQAANVIKRASRAVAALSTSSPSGCPELECVLRSLVPRQASAGCPMSEHKSYIRKDENGVLRVGDGRVMLDSIVAAFQQGHSPDTIRQQYPALTLEEVYGSIAYYLAHLDEVNAYLEQQDQVWKEWQARCEEQPSPVVERLRALRRSGATQTS